MMRIGGPGRRSPTRPAGDPVGVVDAGCRAAFATFAASYPEFVSNGAVTPAGVAKFAAMNEGCAAWVHGVDATTAPVAPAPPTPPASTGRPPLTTAEKAIGVTMLVLAGTTFLLMGYYAYDELSYKLRSRRANPRRARRRR